MTFQTIVYEGPADHAVTLTLNRPERKNAIGPQMANELLWALERAGADEGVRVVVLQGAGNAFCAGGDFAQMMGGDSADALPVKGDYADLLLAMARYEKPLVAKVRGPAMGGGLGLAASCHFALAAHDAVLGTPEIHRGLFPMMIMAVLSRTVARRDLIEMMLLGEKLTAARAAELRLISRAVPSEQLDAEVSSLVAALAARSPTAMRHGLRAWAVQGDEDLEAAVPKLRDALYTLLGTDDAREGLSAFMQKRAPQWTGR